MLYFHTGCGEDFTAMTGQFSSPGYPTALYPHERECTWSIIVPLEYSITLTIHDFEVEEHQDCRYDALEVDITPVLTLYRDAAQK